MTDSLSFERLQYFNGIDFLRVNVSMTPLSSGSCGSCSYVS